MTAVPGMQGMYSGLQLENPSKWQLMCSTRPTTYPYASADAGS